MKIKNIFEFGSTTFGLSNESNKFYLVIIALLIFFAYLPTLQYEYASLDQLRAFRYSIFSEASPLTKARLCFENRIRFDIGSGRLFGSIGEYIEHSFVNKISDFSKTRPLVLIIVIFTAFCMGLALSSSMGGVVNGTAIGALFVLSPGYAFMYYNGLETVMTLIALILATLSYIFVCQAISGKFQKKKLLLSSIFFLVACMIYPAWAYVVFIFSLIDFLFCTKHEWNTKLKQVLIKTFFFATVSIIYYLIIKLIIIFSPHVYLGEHEFSANFSPVYLCLRFFIAVFTYISIPFLNTLYRPLFLLNIIILLSVIVIGTISFFKKSNDKFISTVFSFLVTVLICAFLIFVSMAPWLLSAMKGVTPLRLLITFSLLMCALTGWIICSASTKLFPTKKYISTILLIFIILLPASAIQNKRVSIDVGIKGTETEAMRLVVHKWIDELSFTKKRYIVVVKPRSITPLFYNRVLNNDEVRDVTDKVYKFLKEHICKDEDNLCKIKKYMAFIKEFCNIKSLNGLTYVDSLRFLLNQGAYFRMFTALIREECDRQHPFTLMTIYDLSQTQQTQEEAEEILDASPLNIVFTVVNQGDRIETKHDVLEINFSLITNLPEPLIVEHTKI